MAKEIRNAIAYHKQRAKDLSERGLKMTAERHQEYARQLEEHLRLAY